MQCNMDDGSLPAPGSRVGRVGRFQAPDHAILSPLGI